MYEKFRFLLRLKLNHHHHHHDDRIGSGTLKSGGGYEDRQQKIQKSDSSVCKVNYINEKEEIRIRRES